MKATDVRKGHVLIIDGQPCRVMDFTHRTPGNLRAFVQVRVSKPPQRKYLRHPSQRF